MMMEAAVGLACFCPSACSVKATPVDMIPVYKTEMLLPVRAAQEIGSRNIADEACNEKLSSGKLDDVHLRCEVPDAQDVQRPEQCAGQYDQIRRLYGEAFFHA